MKTGSGVIAAAVRREGLVEAIEGTGGQQRLTPKVSLNNYRLDAANILLRDVYANSLEAMPIRLNFNVVHEIAHVNNGHLHAVKEQLVQVLERDHADFYTGVTAPDFWQPRLKRAAPRLDDIVPRASAFGDVATDMTAASKYFMALAAHAERMVSLQFPNVGKGDLGLAHLIVSAPNEHYIFAAPAEVFGAACEWTTTAVVEQAFRQVAKAFLAHLTRIRGQLHAVNEAICAIFRRFRTPQFQQNYAVIQAPFVYLHGAHPPAGLALSTV